MTPAERAAAIVEAAEARTDPDDRRAELARLIAGAVVDAFERGAAAAAESAWLVEKYFAGRLHYWTGGQAWSTDSLDAVRLARRADAERANEMCKLLGMIAEHVWPAPAPIAASMERRS